MEGNQQSGARAPDALAFFLLLVFTAVMYASPGEWIPQLAPLRLAMASSALAAGLMVARRLACKEPVQLDGFRGFAFLAFAGVVAASRLWTIYPEGTQAELIELLKSVAIYFALINLVQTPRRLVILTLTFIFASIVTSVGAINWYRAGVDLVEGFRTRWVGTYADPNRLAMDIGMVVPLALAFVLRRQTGWLVRAACVVAAGLALVVIVLTHSRGGFLGLASAVVVWTVRERRLKQSVLVATLGLAMLVLAPQSFWKRTETVADFQEDASAMGRVHAWSVAANANKDKPLLGTGAGSFLVAWPIYAPPEAHQAYYAHNVFLQVLAELGWIGFAIFLLFVSAGVAGAFEAGADPDHGWLARAIAAALAGYVVCSLFAGFLISPHFYLLLGLGAAAHRLHANSRARALSPPVPGWAAPAPPG